MKVLIKEKLEFLLQSRWAEFLDRQQMLRLCLECVRDAKYSVSTQSHNYAMQIRASVTKFEITENPSEIELWMEFSVPKDNGLVIGTHVFVLNLTGEIKLKETHGIHFVAETS